MQSLSQLVPTGPVSLPISQIESLLLPRLADISLKLIGAILLWFVGRWVIGFINRALLRGLLSRAMDATLRTWITSIVTIGLNIFLIIAILNVFGIETTSLAALVAAGGLAIGAAWSGLLSNFAAGVFLILFKPFRVGDVVAVAGISGTVVEVTMFATTLNTADNVRTTIGNNAVSTSIIQNFSANPYRAVDLRVQLAASIAPDEAKAVARAALGDIANILADPSPVTEIIEFAEAGPRLVVRPFCHNDHYWQVAYEAQMAIATAFVDAGFPQPSVSLASKPN